MKDKEKANVEVVIHLGIRQIWGQNSSGLIWDPAELIESYKNAPGLGPGGATLLTAEDIWIFFVTST